MAVSAPSLILKASIFSYDIPLAPAPLTRIRHPEPPSFEQPKFDAVVPDRLDVAYTDSVAYVVEPEEALRAIVGVVISNLLPSAAKNCPYFA